MKEKLKYLFENWKTIPNLMSFIRILLIPTFAVLYYKGHVLWAVACLALSGLSDMFDGKVARRFNQVSELGKVLDPVADKLTVFTIAIMLFIKFHSAETHSLQIFSWVFLLFILKDIIMVIGGAFMISKGMRPGAAEIYGKVATATFYIVMVLIMAIGPEVGALVPYIHFALPNSVMMILVIIAVVMTFVAFASYMPATYKQFAEHYGWGKNKKD